MFKTVGETSSFSEDPGGYGSDERSRAGSPTHEDHHNNHHHQTTDDEYNYNPFAQSSPPDSDHEQSEPMTWKKMFWHASRIDKVQELVPEQVRSVILYL